MKILKTKTRHAAVISLALLALAGCGGGGGAPESRGTSRDDMNCMMRAIYFEANRSSRDGMVAVGSVVMNRVESEKYPDTVCGVVSQKNQFAPGVMTRKMNSPVLPDVQEAASAVLRGERHPLVQNAKFFHTYGYTFPYKNMHYVLVAGGNAFYEKRKKYLVTQPVPPAPSDRR